MGYGTELKNSGKPSIDKVSLLSSIKHCSITSGRPKKKKDNKKNKATHQPPLMQGTETARNQNVEKVKEAKK